MYVRQGLLYWKILLKTTEGSSCFHLVGLEVVHQILCCVCAISWVAKKHIQMRIELASKGMRYPKTLERRQCHDNCPREVETDTSFWETHLENRGQN